MIRSRRSVRFSLVLATVGRTEDLGRFLASLQFQTYRDFELIVVDQNPDDRISPLLKPYEEKFPVRHVRMAGKGLSRARNLGLEYVSGNIVAFPDDDCQYPPELLSRVAGTFLEYPGLDGLTGRSVDEGGRTSSGRFATSSGPVDRFNVWGRGISFAIFARSRSVRGIRFDEDLGAGASTAWGSGEETDYLLQIMDRGGKVHYDSDLVVVHPSFVPPYDSKARRKAYSYGCGMGYVLRRHRYPWSHVSVRIMRPLGGTILSAASLRLPKAGYHWNIFMGRLRGLVA